MTENTVGFSIIIKLPEREMKFERKVELSNIEETIQSLMTEIGQQVLGAGISIIDDRIAENVPKGWRNIGSEGRWIVSSIGSVRYKRRIYLDEEKRRRKPVDELLGIERYGRVSERVGGRADWRAGGFWAGLEGACMW